MNGQCRVSGAGVIAPSGAFHPERMVPAVRLAIDRASQIL